MEERCASNTRACVVFLALPLVVRRVHVDHWNEEVVTLAPNLGNTSPGVWQRDRVIKPMCSAQYTNERITLKGELLENNGIF